MSLSLLNIEFELVHPGVTPGFKPNGLHSGFLLQESLTLRPAPHPNHTSSLYNLAIVFQARFVHSSSQADLDTALDFLWDTSCMFCMSNIDNIGGYTLGCGHMFHLACLSQSMASFARCVICRHIIDLATDRVLGIDDVYPGS